MARLKRLGVYATVVFAAFVLGFVPMWLVARTRANERDVVQQALRLTQLENELAAAAIQARRGDYEPAREAASTSTRISVPSSTGVRLGSQHPSAR